MRHLGRTPLLIAASLLGGGASALLPSVASAADSWTSPARLSPTTGSASYPSLLPGSAGAATAIWIQSNDAGAEINAAQRSADGTWSAPSRLSDPAWRVPDVSTWAPQLAAGASGTVYAIWAEAGATSSDVRIRTAQLVNGAWGSPVNVESFATTTTAPSPTIAVDGEGRVIAAWTESGAARSSVRSADGTWPAATTIASDNDRRWEIEGEQHSSSERIRSITLTTCAGQVGALWRVTPYWEWSAGEYGAAGVSPNVLRSKALLTGGAWAEADADVKELKIPSDSGTGSWACAPNGELSVAAIGDVSTPGGRYAPPPTIESHSVTQTGGAWSTPKVFSSVTGPDGFPAPEAGVPATQQLAYGADGALIRVAETDAQTTTLARTAAGAWGAESPLLPASQPTRKPYVSVAPSGLQTLAYVRDTDVPAHVEVRTRANSTDAWSAPTTISASGLPTGDVQLKSAADGTRTALVLQQIGDRWELNATSTTAPPQDIPVSITKRTVTVDLDVQRTAPGCPAINKVWTTPSITVDGVQRALAVASRSITVTPAGRFCTVSGTLTLSKTPASLTGFKVTIGGPGLRYRTAPLS